MDTMTPTPETPSPETAGEPKPQKLRSMPRPAIRAIALSGHFCALTTCFLAYFSWRNGFHPVMTGINVVTAVFLFAGSAWMQRQLYKRP